MAEEAKDPELDWFQGSEQRSQKLRKLVGQMREGTAPIPEMLQQLQELITKSEQAPSRPTKEEKDRRLEGLRQKYGDLPKKTLLLQELSAKIASTHSQMEEMRRPAPLDLHRAIMKGDVDKVHSVLAAGVSVNAKGPTGDSPLRTAWIHRQSKIVTLLREAGAEIGLAEAVELGEWETFQALLDQGADVNTQIQGSTLLTRAAMQGNVAMVRLLLARGADVNAVGELGATPLRSASREEPEIVSLLLAAGAKVGLFEAIHLQDSERILALLNAGADIDGENVGGLTPLMMAASRGDLDLIRLLLSRGANREKACSRNLSVLTWAVSCDQGEIVHFLLDSGMDVNASNRAESEYLRGSTPIRHAILSRLPVMTRLLVERGADLKVRDARGKSPLHWATMAHSPEVLRILLEAGADVNAVDDCGRTALMDTVFSTLDPSDVLNACVRLLLEQGADVNAREEHGKTALMMAANHGHIEVVELLLAAGAEINAADNLGFTALTAPSMDKSEAVQALLRARGATYRWDFLAD